MAAKHSAGVLLFRRVDGDLEVLLVHPGGPYWAKKDDGAWSIPKGEREEGEDSQACALRELAEELGEPPPIAPQEMVALGSVRQRGGKVVEAWAAPGDFDPETLRSQTFSMEWPPRSGGSRDFPEVDRAAWFPPDVARRKVLARQAVFIDRLLAHVDA